MKVSNLDFGTILHNSSYVNTGIHESYTHRCHRVSKKQTVNDKFFDEFCVELDLFDQEKFFPEWIYDYREKNLSKISKKFRVMCQTLRDMGLAFKLKFPIEVEGKWKFADAYIPKYNTAILLISENEMIGLPCHSKCSRELFFENRCSVLAIMNYELSRLREKLKVKLAK